MSISDPVYDDLPTKHCNMATSRLINAPNGRYSCITKWPDLFGGQDGGDILFCGGSILDRATGRIYKDRLPPSNEIGEIESDPRSEMVSIMNNMGDLETNFRWECAHVDGPADDMKNPYVRTSFDRLKKRRNTCAKYIYRAVPAIGFSKGREGFCDCLADHGKINVNADKWLARHEKNNRGATVGDSNYIPTTEGMVSMPNTCSPCKVGGGLDNGSYVVKIARGCVKSFDTTTSTDDLETFQTHLDLFPCGAKGFTEHNKSCSVAVIYVGVGLSEFGRQLVGREMLL